MQEPNLEELKEQVLNESEFVEKIEPAKVKLFKVVGYKTFDAMKNTFNVFDGQKEIEKQINEFFMEQLCGCILFFSCRQSPEKQ